MREPASWAAHYATRSNTRCSANAFCKFSSCVHSCTVIIFGSSELKGLFFSLFFISAGGLTVLNLSAHKCLKAITLWMPFCDHYMLFNSQCARRKSTLRELWKEILPAASSFNHIVILGLKKIKINTTFQKILSAIQQWLQGTLRTFLQCYLFFVVVVFFFKLYPMLSPTPQWPHINSLRPSGQPGRHQDRLPVNHHGPGGGSSGWAVWIPALRLLAVGDLQR